jgi:hypothetical protein
VKLPITPITIGEPVGAAAAVVPGAAAVVAGAAAVVAGAAAVVAGAAAVVAGAAAAVVAGAAVVPELPLLELPQALTSSAPTTTAVEIRAAARWTGLTVVPP